MRVTRLLIVALLCALSLAAVAQTCSGSATLMWNAPTQNTDGSPLTNLAGFKIYWGTTLGTYPNSATINDASARSYIVESLCSGVWHFVSTALNSSSVESAFSNVASKPVQGDLPKVPTPPATLTVTPPDLTAWGVVVTTNNATLVPVGTVAAGTQCNGAKLVLGKYLVPRSAVTFAGSVQPQAVFASCN